MIKLKRRKNIIEILQTLTFPPNQSINMSPLVGIRKLKKGVRPPHSHGGGLFRPKVVYKFMTLSPKDYYLIPGNDAKNLFEPKDVYKFMTLSPNDYYLIPGNGAKNLFGQKYVYKFMTLSPKDYYLIPGNCAKNLLLCSLAIVLIKSSFIKSQSFSLWF